MDYSQYNWIGDFMYSEIIGLPYDEVPDDFAVGLYSPKDSPEINMYINTETGEIIEEWRVEEDDEEN